MINDSSFTFPESKFFKLMGSNASQAGYMKEHLKPKVIEKLPNTGYSGTGGSHHYSSIHIDWKPLIETDKNIEALIGMSFKANCCTNCCLRTYEFVDDSNIILDGDTIKIGVKNPNTGKYYRNANSFCLSIINSSVIKKIPHVKFGYDSSAKRMYVYDVDNNFGEENERLAFFSDRDMNAKYDFKIDVQYKGPRVMYGTEYNPEDIQVKVIYDTEIVYATYLQDFVITNSLVVSTPDTYVAQIHISFVIKDIKYDYYETVNIPVETIKNILVKYLGPDIYIGYNYDINDVDIIIEYLHKPPERIPPNMAIFSGTKCTTLGFSSFYITYENYDPIKFQVPCLQNLISIDGTYSGPVCNSGDEINKDNIKAIVTYHTYGSFETKDFTCEPKILKYEPRTEGLVRVKLLYSDAYESVEGFVDIPIRPLYIRLMAWYEDFPIQTVGEYNPEKVVIYLFPEVGDWIRVPWTYPGISINSVRVENEGETWYTVTYKQPSSKYQEELSDIYPVVGFVKKEFVDLDFLVVYINRETGTEKDYTEYFREMFTIDGVLGIGWNGFLRVVNEELHVYGMYRMIAPKRCGLDNRFDCEWYVYVPHKRALKATISKIFRDEKGGTSNG